ncbi:SMI1/KNR4 family protein [Streptomyces sp. NPDC041068]|uniref:SMI1/KNR4 family protein n=1 Tax=Streptomyces sp. NPDC041068 TaxID=3155130 RepID=UPI0033C2ACF5
MPPSRKCSDQSPDAAPILDFATWEPVLRLLLAAKPERPVAETLRGGGRIGRGSWSLVPRREPPTAPGRAAPSVADEAELSAVERVQSALADAGVDDVRFNATIQPTGKATLRLHGPSPAVESGVESPHGGALLLVEGALPEPWRRLPVPIPGAVPAPSADPVLLERTLHERLPDAIGATEEEIAAAEARLGITLPEELKALYRVTRARQEDWDDDHESANRVCEAVRCELGALDDLYVAGASTRPCPWRYAATEAVLTSPDAAVQGLVGSPGWIVFGENGGGDRLAVDLTPGPRGHVGQVIMLSHEESIGAELIADSLTDMLLDREAEDRRDDASDRPPVVAHVNTARLTSIRAAAHSGLEVLSIGVRDGAPLSLAPLAGLPLLRTLTASPGTLADPLEIARLTGLEFLELGLKEWRVLLDAGAVPRGLKAAAISVHDDQDPQPVVATANAILALWNRPQIIRTVLEGDLGMERPAP